MQRRRGASTGQKWMCRQCWHYICRSLSSQTSASAACLEPVTRIPSRSVWLHTLSAGSLCLPSTLRKRTEGELEGSTSARSKLFDILVLKCQLLNYQGAFFFFPGCSAFPHVTVCKHFISKHHGGKISYLKLIKQFGMEAAAITSKWIRAFWGLASSRDNILGIDCSEGGWEAVLTRTVTFLPALLPMLLGPCPNERSYAARLYCTSPWHGANSMFGAIT